MGLWSLYTYQHAFTLVCFVCVHLAASAQSLQIIGFTAEHGKYDHSGVLLINATVDRTLRLFGRGLNSSAARIVLVEELLPLGSLCDDEKDSNPFHIYNATDNTGLVTINFAVTQNTKYYFCVKTGNTLSSHYIHQGTSKWLSIVIVPLPEASQTTILPLPLQILIICVLLILSGIFSGLNLGLMSLDPMELQIVMKSGTKSEQRFASIIYPIRKKGNFLLCTLLLGNVLVNNTLTILLGDLTSGIWAIVGSTAGIVIFGEIVPQAICSRYGLRVGAYTIWLTKLFMVITFLVSYPISKVLDLILGKEIGTIYNRKKLLEMLKVTDPYNDLHADEVNIIQGALELRTKTVEEAMTPIEDCFMVEISSMLNFETMREIMSTGYTRIPVYDKERTNVMSILFVKDLAFVDPDDCMPLKTVCKFYQHPLNFVFSDITLDKLLEEFKQGVFHMAMVHKVNNEGPGDPFYEVIGIITLEDVIEEIIKSEIVDETDVYTDNKTKKLNMQRQKTPIDLSLFTEQMGENKKPAVTPQILLAAHRFLLAEVEPFKALTDKILLRLLKQDVVISLNLQDIDRNSEKLYIYKKAKPADYFVLILEGQVKVIAGLENLEFQGGPFSCYGLPALVGTSASQASKHSHSRTNSMSRASVGCQSPITQEGYPDVDINHDSLTPLPSYVEANLSHGPPFHPDYDLIATSNVKYVKITRNQYMNAVRATKMSEAGHLDEASGSISESITLMRNPSKKSVSSVQGNNNNHNGTREMEDLDKSQDYSVSQSHPELAPAQKPAPHFRQHKKSMSSGQLMAIAAKYATIAGDRVHPSVVLPVTDLGRSSPRKRSLNLGTSSLKQGDEKSSKDIASTSVERKTPLTSTLSNPSETTNLIDSTEQDSV